MLPEKMKKGEYVVKGNRAMRIRRTKRHPEYDDDKVYILEGNYGIELPPYEREELQEAGFDKCVDIKELNKMMRDGEYNPEYLVLKLRK